jgi:hypothetical protein
MANSEKGERLDDELDALFALSLAEFTGERNALAARLKKLGRAADAERVKALGKPSVSAWAVNQLYWKHRKAFDVLIAAGDRFRKAQALQLAGKTADTRAPLDARREALSELSHLAAALLRDADHNPTPEMMRRIGTTLEAMSAYATLPDTSPAGRLTADLDPPGFESLAALMPGSADRAPVPSKKDTRQAAIALAKASLKEAERALTEARVQAQRAEAAMKKAGADAREAEARLQKASLASEEAAKAVEEAERAVEKASRELRLQSGE